MKKVANLLVAVLLILSFSCFKSGDIAVKYGTIETPGKGEFRMWKGIKHGRFTVRLTNTDAKQSVELYTVKSNGAEKWVSPSLLANTSLTVTIPANGHLFVKNFNDNAFTISYQIQ